MRRAGIIYRLTIASIVGGIAVGSCNDSAPDRGGLMLVIQTDGSLPIDRLDVGVEHEDRVLHRQSYRVPDEAELPTTFAIASNGDPTASVELSVTGWNQELPLDRRDAIVRQIPSDRLAMLKVVLSSRCSSRVHLKGDEAISTCGEGRTCDPMTGECRSAEVNASELPTYESGAENIGSGGAGFDAGGSEGDPSLGGGGGGSSQPQGGSETGGVPAQGGQLGSAGFEPGVGGSEAGMAGSMSSPCGGDPCPDLDIVNEQWQESTHFAPSNLNGGEVPSWTGSVACGNCHAPDALELRVAGTVGYMGTSGPTGVTQGQLRYRASTNFAVAESTYAGSATVAGVRCKTCHEISNDTAYVFGAPLRVPVGPSDEPLLEKSAVAGVVEGTPAGDFNRGNVCVWCHKSRMDITNQIAANNYLSTHYWGPHAGPQADVYSGRGGYHYASKVYNSSSHTAMLDGCVNCHMPAVPSNQDAPNHSVKPQLSACQTAGCHSSATSFDILGGQSAISASLQELRVTLNDQGWLTRSSGVPFNELDANQLTNQNFEIDRARPGATLNADQAGALYNYLAIAGDRSRGVHNPVYVRQLIYDSYFSITGQAPITIQVRP